MSAGASQITGTSIVCSTVCWGADKKKNIKAPRHCSFCFFGESTGDPSLRVSNPENVSSSWRNQDDFAAPVDQSIWTLMSWKRCRSLNKLAFLLTNCRINHHAMAPHIKLCLNVFIIQTSFEKEPEWDKPIINDGDAMTWNTFRIYLSFVRRIYRSPVDSSAKEPALWGFDLTLYPKQAAEENYNYKPLKKTF